MNGNDMNSLVNNIIKLNEPNKVEYCENTYIDKSMHLMQRPKAGIVNLGTLNSLVTMIKEEYVDYKHLYVLVNDPNSVMVFTEIGENREREGLFQAKCDRYFHSLNRESLEMSIIRLKSIFSETPDREMLIKQLSCICQEDSVTTNDDGVSQVVTTSQGIARKGKETTKAIVELRPFRTFPEIDQPASEFLFRLDSKSSEVTASLYEADGGLWEVEAKQNVAEYLNDMLFDDIPNPDNISLYNKVTVIW